MENQSSSDAPSAVGQQQPGSASGLSAAVPPPPQQLPPQMFTTAAQLLDLTDKKLIVSLRDGRKLIGVLRSWDQFANLILQSTIERVFTTSHQPPLYADIPRGVFLVRGENVLLLGEIDLDKDDDIPPGYQMASVETVHSIAKREAKERKGREKVKVGKLRQLGFEGENVGEVLLG